MGEQGNPPQEKKEKTEQPLGGMKSWEITLPQKNETWYKICFKIEHMLAVAAVVASILEFPGRFYPLLPGVVGPAGLLDGLVEVAKAVGIGSVLIAWICTALGKTESGIVYADMLGSDYGRILCFHVAGVLATLLLAKMSCTIAACLWVCVVATGLIFQWNAFSLLMLNPQKRKERAAEIWDRRIEKCVKENMTDELSTNLRILSGVLRESGLLYNYGLYRCLARGMLQMPEQWDRRLRLLSEVWDGLLRDRKRNEQAELAKNVFAELGEIEGTKETVGAVGVSYVLWSLRYRAEILPENKNEQKALPRMKQMQRDTRALYRTLEDIELITKWASTEKQKSLVKYMEGAFAVQSQMHLVYRDVQLDRDLLRVRPKDGIDPEMEVLLREFASAIFMAEDWEKVFESALKRINSGTEKNQGRGGVSAGTSRTT